MNWPLELISYQPWVHISNAFTKQELKKILDLRKEYEQTEGKVGNNGDVVESIRDSNIWWLFPKPEVYWLYQKLTGLINDINKQHFQMDLTSLAPLQLTEYDSSKEGHYGQHIDSQYEPGESQNRKLSFSLQLTDAKKYNGGELKLYPNNFNNPIIAPKQKGDITFFRSHIIHEVTPVTKGIRHSLVGWISGPLFK